MTPSRLRLAALLALAVPIVMTAAASGANAGFGALALASAAAGFAMLLAGPVFRTILAGLIGLLGVCVVLVGVFGPAVDALVVVAIVGGGLQVLVAVWVATTVRHWPAATSRYSRSRLEGDPASDWDALSAGDDPTEPR
jgi:hypothetical protein